MGSWNGTCMISNLPIMSGDKIKLVLLQPRFSSKKFVCSGYCYSTGLMTPLFLPIEGEYNDYGMIENIVEDWNFKLIEDYFKRKFSQIYGGYENQPIKDFTLTDILSSIERGNLKVIKNGEEDYAELNLAFTMIRKDVWDGIYEKYVGEFWNDNHKETDEGHFYISVKEYCTRKFNQFVDECEAIDKIENDKSAIQKLMHNSLFNSGNMFRDFSTSLLKSQLYNFFT